MPKKTKVSGTATSGEIEAAYKDSTNPHDQKRLLALQMAQQGVWILAEIGKALGKGRATVGRWLKAYREDGVEGLLERGHGGREPQLKQDDIEALGEVLQEGQYKTAKEIRHWLEQERGIEMSIWGVYYWLKKVKASHKLPRKVHTKQDPDEREAFKEDIVDKLQELDIPAGRPVRIWIQDEHRYGLISTIRRCWTLRGHEVRAPYKAEYKWGYVYGALEFVTGDAEFLYMSTVSLECSHLFLEQLVATDPEAIHIVIWDQAGFHPKAEQHQLPEQIRLLPLPAYCPELSPIEKLWDLVKRDVSNTVWETLEAIENGITKVLKPFWESPERVSTFLGDNWLTVGVADFLKLRQSLI
jgi:transposase